MNEIVFEEESWRLGYKSGLSGKSHQEIPYQLGIPEDKRPLSWLDGFTQGMADRESENC